jgi:hypothetical protein
MHRIDEIVFGLAAAQGGAFARWQLVAHGADDKIIERRCTAGLWVRVRPGVFVLPGLPPADATALWVAWLAVGPHASRSHECAADHWTLQPVVRHRHVFTTTHGDHHHLQGITVHQLRDLLPHHLVVADGMPTTTPARTVVDLAAIVSFERLKRIVENGVNDHIVTDHEVGAVLQEVARPGKWGVRRLTRVLAMRAPGDPVPDSVLERLLLHALRSVGLPDPVPQYPHPGREIGTGWVDYAYPDARLILEADGRRWHQRIADLKRDNARDKAASRAGWLTMRFMHEELTADPDEQGRSVIEALSHRTAA